MIILRIEQEICSHNGDADCDDNQDEEHQEHEAIYIIDLHIEMLAAAQGIQ